MNRTAQVNRTTGETEISLRLRLDGTGQGERRTGVGFFDHMLDAVARHGGLDLDGKQLPVDRVLDKTRKLA